MAGSFEEPVGLRPGVVTGYKHETTGYVRRGFNQLLVQGLPTHRRHLEIADHTVDLSTLDDGVALETIADRRHLVAETPEQPSHHGAIAVVILYDQQATRSDSVMIDHGNGTASGELNNLSGPVPTETIDLNGSVTGSTFVLGGNNEAFNIVCIP